MKDKSQKLKKGGNGERSAYKEKNGRSGQQSHRYDCGDDRRGIYGACS